MFNSKFWIYRLLRHSLWASATSSTLEEEFDKYKNVIPQNRLDDFDWKVAIKARAKSACTFCRAVATKRRVAD